MLFFDNHQIPDLPNVTIFDTKQAILLFYSYMEDVVYFLKHTFFTFPATFYDNFSTWYISYWDLFFSGWAVLLIISWIPEIGPTIAAAGDQNDTEEDDWIFF